MIEPGSHLGLTLETRLRGGVSAVNHDFHCHQLVEKCVPSPVDNTHIAPAQESFDYKSSDLFIHRLAATKIHAFQMEGYIRKLDTQSPDRIVIERHSLQIDLDQSARLDETPNTSCCKLIA